MENSRYFGTITVERGSEMDKMISQICVDELASFLTKMTKYLYDWTCTRTGEYEHVSYQDWQKEFMRQYNAHGCKYFIDEYKDDVNNNRFAILYHCIALLKPYRDVLYNEHLTRMREFEREYGINQY